MEFQYSVCQDGISLDKVTDPDQLVVIPEELDGKPMVMLGSYALSGTTVEEIHLPGTLKKIGAYAFYNCDRLKRLYMYGSTLDLGTGLFAGCGQMELLDLTLDVNVRTCFQEVLDEMRQLLRVHLHVMNAPHAENSADKKTQEVRLLFPAYYEEAIENSPVRIEVRESNSCGHRYRYCFTRRIFQFSQYDSLFAYAEVYERTEIAAELAISRLQFPHGLSETGRKRYTEYLKTNWEAAGKILLNHSNPGHAATNLVSGLMPWFVEKILENPSEEMLQTMTGHAQSAQDTETVSWLMNYRHERYGQTESSRDENRKRKRRKVRFSLDESNDI